MTRLPVLDLREFDDAAARAGFLARLRSAARDVGFFYLVGHGVDAALAPEIFALSRRFFALPEADKLAIQMANSPHFRGYTRLGDERTAGRTDWREQLDVGLEVPALKLSDGDPPWKRLQGPNQWPAALPELRPALLRWHAEVFPVASRVLRAFALALEQPEDVFDEACAGIPNQVVKTIRYPGRDTAASDQGCGAHKDSEFVTLLYQHEIGGLQVWSDGEGDAGGSGEGDWIDAPPLPGSFVVNAGELLELASDGYLRATLHRVVAPPAGSERLSLAFFLAARLDAAVPLLQLPAHLAAEARGPARDPSNPLYREVGLNTLKGRLRSHPDVARRHYADLLAPVVGASP
ncbi:MAG TPA: 2-oxoglutarate and iron-dependent oxygenase domain-containing protein [Steroidobacteraceae bacterium]|jgi:isopenicillin N synthase-like dioxygenase|nr:2-oxoglutarate and iron-dependent oxygenase domain-containing protein [Steroidobacteraceae bacterium]